MQQVRQINFHLPAQPIIVRPVRLIGPAVEPIIEFIVNPKGIAPAANDEITLQ
jgi:hypothetical protein